MGVRSSTCGRTLAALAALAIARTAACTKDPPASSADAAEPARDPAPTREPEVDPRAATRFVWRVAFDPGTPGATTRTSLGPREALALPLEPWACGLEVTPGDGPTAELGVLTCTHAPSREAIGTTVLCLDRGHGDCGTGVVRLADARGAPHVVEVTCGCDPEAATTRWDDAALAPGPAPHFVWQLDAQSPTGRSANMPMRSGDDVPATLDGWRCVSYLARGAPSGAGDPTAVLEAGRVSCTSAASGQVVATQIVCREDARTPSFCNAGSLRLGTARGDLNTVVVRCKSARDECF